LILGRVHAGEDGRGYPQVQGRSDLDISIGSLEHSDGHAGGLEHLCVIGHRVREAFEGVEQERAIEDLGCLGSPKAGSVRGLHHVTSRNPLDGVGYR
jgi:hypothetical protein